MKSTHRLLAILAVAALAVASFWRDVCETVATAYSAAKSFAFRVADFGLKLFATEPAAVIKNQPQRMRQYKQRKDRRETPVITASWRMCPST